MGNYKLYSEIVKEIKAATPDFNENYFYILIVEKSILNGIDIGYFNFSKDKKWVCIPHKVNNQFVPMCYEVASNITIKGYEVVILYK